MLGSISSDKVKFCMVPQLRVDDPDYTRVWRRRKSIVPTGEVSPRDITERVKALSIEKGADLVGIASAEELGEIGISAKNYLPEGTAAMVIGTEYPSSYDENPSALSYIRGVMTTKLQFISLDISSHLERLGYSTSVAAGVLLRSNEDASSGYRIWLRDDSSGFQFSIWQDNAYTNVVADAAQRATAGEVHHLKIEMEGFSFSAWIDGNMVLHDQVDPDALFPSGRIGLINYNCHVQYDNLTISGDTIAAVTPGGKLTAAWGSIKRSD